MSFFWQGHYIHFNATRGPFTHDGSLLWNISAPIDWFIEFACACQGARSNFNASMEKLLWTQFDPEEKRFFFTIHLYGATNTCIITPDYVYKHFASLCYFNAITSQLKYDIQVVTDGLTRAITESVQVLSLQQFEFIFVCFPDIHLKSEPDHDSPLNSVAQSTSPPMTWPCNMEDGCCLARH